MSDHPPVKDEGESIPFFPNHFITEAKVVLGIVILVVIIGTIGLFAPVGVEEPADPLNTPEHVKPEWYFLALYQLLKFVPETLGVTALVLAVIFVFIWPFIDHKKETTTKTRKIRFIIAITGVIIYIALTIWGGM